MWTMSLKLEREKLQQRVEVEGNWLHVEVSKSMFVLLASAMYCHFFIVNFWPMINMFWKRGDRAFWTRYDGKVLFNTIIYVKCNRQLNIWKREISYYIFIAYAKLHTLGRSYAKNAIFRIILYFAVKMIFLLCWL